MRTALTRVALLVALAMTVAACSGDADPVSTETEDATAAPTTAPPAATATTEPPEATPPAPTPTPATTPASPAAPTEDVAAADGAYCQELITFTEEFGDESQTVVTPEIVEATRELADGAPPELADTLNALADGYERVVGVDFSDPENADVLLEDTEFFQAGLDLGEYLATSCGVTG